MLKIINKIKIKNCNFTKKTSFLERKFKFLSQAYNFRENFCHYKFKLPFLISILSSDI